MVKPEEIRRKALEEAAACVRDEGLIQGWAAADKIMDLCGPTDQEQLVRMREALRDIERVAEPHSWVARVARRGLKS